MISLKNLKKKYDENNIKIRMNKSALTFQKLHHCYEKTVGKRKFGKPRL